MASHPNSGLRPPEKLIEGEQVDDADELSHSSKKAKANSGEPRTSEVGGVEQSRDGASPASEERRKLSYKEKVLGAAFPVPELTMKDDDADLDSESDVDSGDEEDETCPVIRLTSEQKWRLRAPWRQALIVKMLGKKVGYRFMERKLNQLWATNGHIHVTDVGGDFYVVRFLSVVDFNNALKNGPWMIADHYLTIRKWVPNFDPKFEQITRTMVWVHIPDLPLEYYDKEFLATIGNRIRKIFRIDAATSSATRGQYAKMSVEVDLTKPLVSKFRLRRRTWKVEYEGLHLVCFTCGCYGHKDNQCYVSGPPEPQPNFQPQGTPETQENDKTPDAELERPEIHKNYGPWMLVKKPNRRRANPPHSEPKTQVAREVPRVGSRFEALREINQEEAQIAQVDKMKNIAMSSGKENMEPLLQTKGASLRTSKTYTRTPSHKGESSTSPVARSSLKPTTVPTHQTSPLGGTLPTPKDDVSPIHRVTSIIPHEHKVSTPQPMEILYSPPITPHETFLCNLPTQELPEQARVHGKSNKIDQAEAIQSLMNMETLRSHHLGCTNDMTHSLGGPPSCKTVVPGTPQGLPPLEEGSATVGLSDMDVESHSHIPSK
ncbi:hypothetical protein Tsubulata_034976 [Turnera subulata]|uniref:DUF4283 domain-containing protein n=1 Tax=Turnera subulata TaxID=218843 RepID=A0A9Q0F7U8_9ROSI|nr:hypothetical protein Tsubulata_034976 [Turnera subulata]